MTDTNAAQADSLDNFVQEAIDQDSKEIEQESQPIESAPIKEEVKEVEATPEAKAEEKPREDGFQKRINKVTEDKYEAIRRADALQAKLDSFEKNKVEPVKPPTLEDHDYDEAAFNQSNTQYLVQQELAKQSQAQQAAQAQTKAQQVQAEFGERIAALNKEDFNVKSAAIPVLPNGVADALIESKDGAELIYHLGSHLDQADALANMTPSAALMEIGRMSLSLNKKPETKLSAAPEPIEPLKAGGALTSDIGGEMSIDAWMSKYN